MVLSGGTTGNIVTVSSPSQLRFSSGTLDNVSFAGSDLSGALNVNVSNGLSLSGHTFNLAFGTTTFINTQTIDNLVINGTATGNPSDLLVSPSNPVTLTIGSNALLHGNLLLGFNAPAGSSIVNNGTMTGDAAIGSLWVRNTTFQNNTLAQAINGGSLLIDSNQWVNAPGATISANASLLELGGNFTNLGSITTLGAATVNLSGTFTLASLGNYTPSSNTTTTIFGTLDNTGQTLTLAGAQGKWYLWGTLLNGNLNCGTNMYVVNATLNGVTNNPGNVIDVQYLDQLNMTGSWNNAGIIQATGAATINLGATFSTSNIGTMNFAPTTTVNITGFLNNTANNLSWASGSWTLLGGTISGGQLNLPASQQLYAYGGTFQGVTINANSNVVVDPQATLYAYNSTSNRGLISVGQGILNVDPTFSNSGTISLHGGTLHALNAAHTQTGTFNLGDGTLTGSGTVTGNLVLSSDPSQLSFNIGGTNQGTTYDSLTVTGNVSLAGDLNLTLESGVQNTLTAGETFDILTVTANSLTGAFDDVASGGRLETTDGLGSFEVDYGTGPNANEIILSNFTATPEPSSLTLLIGSAFLMRRRRPKHLTR